MRAGATLRGRMRDLHLISPERIAPFCPWFGTCGGCATQDIPLAVQLHWKRDAVIAALAHEGIATEVATCLDAHGEGRRRATFHSRQGDDGAMRVGFMAARSHDIVAIDACPLFAPPMAGALAAARMIATPLASLGKPLDIAVTASDEGLDVDVRGSGPLEPRMLATLTRAAERAGLARLSNHGRPIVAFRPSTVTIGQARVALPPGTFLQATQAGETALATLVINAVGPSQRIADLFSGVGTFALRLAAKAEVLAVDAGEAALAALQAAMGASAHLHPIRAEVRDLVRRPLTVSEFAPFGAVVFDPPRAGAPDQARELAQSRVPIVVGVSCNPQTFARDAKLLIEGGYVLERVTPVDQFRHSTHVELVGIFRRAKVRKQRRLLG